MPDRLPLHYKYIYIFYMYRISAPATAGLASDCQIAEGLDVNYCKTHFRCILMSRFWNVEISPHFNLAFSQRSTSIYRAFEIQGVFSHMNSIMHYVLNVRLLLLFLACWCHFLMK